MYILFFVQLLHFFNELTIKIVFFVKESIACSSVKAYTVQSARNRHKPSDPGCQNYPRAVEHHGRTPVDPGGHDPRVSR